jgi:hypothetical protein
MRIMGHTNIGEIYFCEGSPAEPKGFETAVLNRDNRRVISETGSSGGAVEGQRILVNGNPAGFHNVREHRLRVSGGPYGNLNHRPDFSPFKRVTDLK